MDSNRISQSTPRITTGPGPSPASPGLENTGKTFQQALDALSSDESQSDQLLQKLATGEDINIHQAVAAAEETDINFRVAMSIRDRLVDAYREVMRMSV